jgi:hypothetical protein
LAAASAIREDRRVADVEHLKLIEAVVGRMGGNSFLLKGWTVTLVAGLGALASANGDRSFAWIAAGVVVLFCLLDAFYLALERSYRELYQKVAADSPDVKRWELETKVGPAEVARALRAFAVLPFYAAALAGSIAVGLSA